MAKIEKPAAVDALDEIIAMSEPGGPVVDQLLGLPVKGWRQARLDEQK